MFFVVLTGYYMIFIFIDPVGAKNTLIKLYRNIQSMIRERLSEEEK
jgi:small neutral amino acid transporter SnatA (MarC family)